MLGLAVFAFLLTGFVFVRTWCMISDQTEALSATQAKLALQFDLAIRHHIGDSQHQSNPTMKLNDFNTLGAMYTYYLSSSVFEEIRKQFPDYLIRVCSNNPVNPDNKAGPEELRLIQYFYEHPKATQWNGRMEISGSKYIVFCTPRRMDDSCLQCHAKLKDEEEFNLADSNYKEAIKESDNKAMALDIVGIPLDKLYSKIYSEALTQLIILAIGCLFLFGGAFIVFKLVIGNRLTAITEHFKKTATQDQGPRIPFITVSGGDEIGLLASSYNSLAAKMELLYDSMEHKVEERTAKLQEEIVERVMIEQKLLRAKEAAETASRAKSDFLANISHEIRTPMTAIMGYFDVLLENLPYNPDTADAALTIKRNCEHLLKIINDILDVSKIESGKMEVEQTSCSPCSIIAEIASLMRIRAIAKGLPLEVEYQGTIPETIQSDPTRLRQILLNIVGNAVKFTESGSIKLIAKYLSDASKLQIQVIDTGVGIANEQLYQLFKPFTQADTSMRRQFDGTGLGLTISKRLLSLLGGDISVESTIGKGSTFTILIPTGPLGGVKMLSNPNEMLLRYQEEKNANAAKAMQLPKGCKILLAEDGAENQRLISFLLKKAGADVTVVENGKLAVDAALASREEGKPFDAILMDMQMPQMDGYDATKLLRSHKWSRPIIALTAHAMSEDRVKCLNAGCNEYLTKPIDRASLLQMIAQFVIDQEVTDPTIIKSI